MITIPELGTRFTTTHLGQTKHVTVVKVRSRNTRVTLREDDRVDTYTIPMKEFGRRYAPLS